MKIVLLPILMLFVLGACDRVEEDVFDGPPTATMTINQSGLQEGGVWLALEDSPLLIPIYGDFSGGEVTVTSSIPGVKEVERREAPVSSLTHDLVVFLEYSSDEPVEFIDYQIFIDDVLSVSDTIQVDKYSRSVKACDGSELYDRHVVSHNGVLTVNLLDNEVFCGLDFSSGGLRYFPISEDTDGIHLSIGPGSNATLTYTPPEGFTGTVEFIYELCFGWNSDPSEDGEIQDHWKNPIESCPYHYVARTTIEVVDFSTP